MWHFWRDDRQRAGSRKTRRILSNLGAFWHILQLAHPPSRTFASPLDGTRVPEAYEYPRLILAQHDAWPDAQAKYAD